MILRRAFLTVLGGPAYHTTGHLTTGHLTAGHLTAGHLDSIAILPRRRKQSLAVRLNRQHAMAFSSLIPARTRKFSRPVRVLPSIAAARMVCLERAVRTT
ncbi:hypothetical protein DCS_03208 [Drechmeria coniospora]|uniref:Uncharacterized protein n=1 Tax=Drechmeria coniospora TaxID=98403 RepID=A0A151GYF4_DRECN|nr:hypothetical protein DCS_03208 [Drechmeria coniospora]KYK62063.1 hypothetical protein DCS_03208 [Drechmeria coniospora]